MKNKKSKLDFEPAEDNKFSAIVNFENGYSLKIDFTVDCSKLQNGYMMYDDVIDALYEKEDKLYPEIDFSINSKVDINIYCNETQEWCPVVAESMKDEIKKLENSKTYSRFLVLPEATYTVTPEMKLFLDMKKNGMLKEDASFNFDKLHEMLKNIKFNNKDIE